MVSEAVNATIPDRSQEYCLLFDDGLTLPEQLANVAYSNLALTALVRVSNYRIRPNSYAQSERRKAIAQGISLILSSNHIPTTEAASSVSTNLVLKWDHACYQNNVPSPFEPLMTDEDVQKDVIPLIRETVLQTNTLLNDFPTKEKTERGLRWASVLLGYYGPSYARRWLTGEEAARIVSDDERMSTEFAPYLNLSMLRRLAARHKGDLEGTLKEAGRIATEELSIDAITQLFQWEKERTEAFFTPYLRTYTAGTRPLSAKDTILTYKKHIEETLSDRSLLDNLGISLDDLFHHITPSMLRHAAINNSKDPLSYVSGIVQTIKKLITSFEFPPALALHVAQSNSKKQLVEKARLIRAAIINSPPDVNPTLWGYATNAHPFDEQRRWDYVRSSFLFWGSALGTSVGREIQLVEVAADVSSEPSHVFERQENQYMAQREIQALALKAGISLEELEELIDTFAQKDTDLSSVQSQMMERLRAVAAERTVE